MRIGTAIILKESYLRNPLCNLNKEEREADQLSIEALKIFRERRRGINRSHWIIIPGETKD